MVLGLPGSVESAERRITQVAAGGFLLFLFCN